MQTGSLQGVQWQASQQRSVNSGLSVHSGQWQWPAQSGPKVGSPPVCACDWSRSMTKPFFASHVPPPPGCRPVRPRVRICPDRNSHSLPWHSPSGHRRSSSMTILSAAITDAGPFNEIAWSPSPAFSLHRSSTKGKVQRVILASSEAADRHEGYQNIAPWPRTTCVLQDPVSTFPSFSAPRLLQRCLSRSADRC